MGLIRFKDKTGKVKFILRDEDKYPIEIDEIADDILEQLGLKEKDVEEIKDKLKPQGIVQDDDLKFLKGD